MIKYKELYNVLFSQIGYQEGKGNNNKYGKSFNQNYLPWCVFFIRWGFNQVNAIEHFPKTGSCTEVKKWAIKNGKWVTSDYKIGDVLIMTTNGSKINPAYHMGLIYKIIGDNLYTIEGNTSATNKGSQNNGEGVYSKIRNIKMAIGAYRPDYIEEIVEYQMISVQMPMLQKGHKGNTVKILQTILNLYDNNLKCDGIFGTNTEEAVKRFQKKFNLEVDGIVGKNTWTTLLN